LAISRSATEKLWKHAPAQGPFMTTAGKATRIQLFTLSTPQMRAFHLSWLAFFVCFFAWFAVAPLMPVIKGDLGLDKDQIANINIAAVGITILVRLIVGPLCDKYGPRLTYTTLLVLGALPVMGIAFAHSYVTFLFARLLIGAIGASFVITQYHTSVMFAPNVVGAANATSAGWGNSGGGVTQSAMPWVLALLLGLGLSSHLSWRVAMFLPGVMMWVVAVLYFKYAQDCPLGNYRDLRERGVDVEGTKRAGWQVFVAATRNYRVWMLFLTYGCCFGVELFVHNVAATYYVERFHLSLQSAGMAAGSFGLLALFARALGGLISDRCARLRGLDARTLLLFLLMLGEGLGLLWFSRAGSVTIGITAMIVFGLFTHMACGATYALVPFIDRKSLGGVAGVVGAGGNVGAVLAGFLLKGVGNMEHCFALLGGIVTVTSLCAVAVRFSAAHKESERRLYEEAMADRQRDERSVATGLSARPT
jgi:NNP family nitrate/nitrite transporter-like MFS transporter